MMNLIQAYVSTGVGLDVSFPHCGTPGKHFGRWSAWYALHMILRPDLQRLKDAQSVNGYFFRLVKYRAIGLIELAQLGICHWLLQKIIGDLINSSCGHHFAQPGICCGQAQGLSSCQQEFLVD